VYDRVANSTGDYKEANARRRPARHFFHFGNHMNRKFDSSIGHVSNNPKSVKIPEQGWHNRCAGRKGPRKTQSGQVRYSENVTSTMFIKRSSGLPVQTYLSVRYSPYNLHYKRPVRPLWTPFNASL